MRVKSSIKQCWIALGPVLSAPSDRISLRLQFSQLCRGHNIAALSGRRSVLLAHPNGCSFAQKTLESLLAREKHPNCRLIDQGDVCIATENREIFRVQSLVLLLGLKMGDWWSLELATWQSGVIKLLVESMQILVNRAIKLDRCKCRFCNIS